MRLQKKEGVIVPMLVVPNGKVEKFNKIANDPEIKKNYKELMNKYKNNPQEVAKRLREATWGKKSLDEIADEL